mgnify:CR=1 FL=1
MKAKIIQIDTHDTNSGILYSTEEITTAIDALKENSGFGVLGIPSDIVLDLNQVCLDWNNMKIEDGWLVADIKILDTPYGNCIKEIDYTKIKIHKIYNKFTKKLHALYKNKIFLCKKCMQIDRMKKVEKTNMERYGVSNIFQLDTIKEKIKQDFSN